MGQNQGSFRLNAQPKSPTRNNPPSDKQAETNPFSKSEEFRDRFFFVVIHVAPPSPEGVKGILPREVYTHTASFSVVFDS